MASGTNDRIPSVAQDYNDKEEGSVYFASMADPPRAHLNDSGSIIPIKDLQTGEAEVIAPTQEGTGVNQTDAKTIEWYIFES